MLDREDLDDEMHAAGRVARREMMGTRSARAGIAGPSPWVGHPPALQCLHAPARVKGGLTAVATRSPAATLDPGTRLEAIRAYRGMAEDRSPTTSPWSYTRRSPSSVAARTGRAP